MPGDSLAPPPPALTLNTHIRQSNNGDDDITPSHMSTISNPFLTPSISNPFLTPSNRSRASSVATTTVNTDAALRPDPGTEADFHVENNPFTFSPGQLNKLLNPKSLLAFRALGGLEGIQAGLHTDVKSGLSVDATSIRSGDTYSETAQDRTSRFTPSEKSQTLQDGEKQCRDRIRVFGTNKLPAKKPTPLWKVMWKAYNDKVLLLLTAAAIISLALGIYQTVGVYHGPEDPPAVDWIEGVAICVAIIIVTVVGGLNDWQQERAFVKLNKKKEDREIKVIRSGKSCMLNVNDILVGDILHLEAGDLIPVDGIFISGHNLTCDESSATGESDVIKKTGGAQVFQMLETGQKTRKDLDPFIISGAKVTEGVGTFLCTSVGVNSSYGKIMMCVRTEIESTPLQKKLERLAMAIAKLGVAAAGLLLLVLLIRFLISLRWDTRTAPEKAITFMNILIVAITIIVVAVPEGLPLAVTLALAFATTRLLKENNLVRVLRACETMGNATTICSDKTGTLTTNKMTVVAGTFGASSFCKPESEKQNIQNTSKWASNLSTEVKNAIIQSVAINSTAFDSNDVSQSPFIGSKTETALLLLARDHLGMQAVSEVRANEEVVQMMPFDSDKKCMGAVIRLRSGGYRLLVKGASEILLSYCATKADISTLAESELNPTERDALRATIDDYAKQSLRTIALVYRDHAQWPPAGVELVDGRVDLSTVLLDLVFLGVVGIQDPVRSGVPEAVKQAQHAGVFVRMVTGDNAVTAEAIATECGIYTDGIIMEGPVFRTLNDDEMNQTIPKLQVLARSSPEDKKILVTRLKALGETVAVTGDGTNDAPALKAADVGFSMGIAGTEVAKEASSIVLMDDNFASIIVALKWGRAVNDSVQKFLQFQITVNITATLLAFVSAVSNKDMQSVLTAVQLLWLNLIMDTLAALALATDPPTDKILDRPPQPKSAPLITINMWKMIIGQAFFQMLVTCVFHFGGKRIFGFEDNVLDTMVFNTFVWMQIFNEFNNRRLDNKFNIFEGLHRNKFFIVINCIMVGCQITIIFVGGQVFTVVPLDIYQWIACLVPAALSLPWAMILRLFPDESFAKMARIVGAPVVVVYRPMAKWWSQIGRRIKKMSGRNTTDKQVETATEIENREWPACDVVSGGAPELVISQADAVGPIISVSDVERWPSRSSLDAGLDRA